MNHDRIGGREKGISYSRTLQSCGLSFYFPKCLVNTESSNMLNL